MARPKKNDKKDKMTLSFTEFDEDVYDYLAESRNASALVRFLVRSHMHREGANVAMPAEVYEDLTTNTSVSEETPVAPKEEQPIRRTVRGSMTSSVNNDSIKAIQNTDLNY